MVWRNEGLTWKRMKDKQEAARGITEMNERLLNVFLKFEKEKIESQ